MAKTVKILGMGRVPAEYNGVSRVEYYEALRAVSKWHGLAPYQASDAMAGKARELKEQQN